MQKILQLEFIPRSADLALLVLRLWLGLSMALLHGWGKVAALVAGKNMFEKPILGLGAWPEFALVTFAEFACALLVAIGLWTRLASFFMVVTMAVAFFMAHGMKLSGPMSGEVAYLYLAGYFTLLIAGAGKFSFDKK
ncbi:MAG: DoxX family protein [Candidatus Didemnitutus sp.]|nr:DoxX family protein [Candidatus Didemnitutus sp.]